MRSTRLLVSFAALAAAAAAQDQVVLSNKDVLTGKVKTMAGGKLTIESPVLGDVTVEMSKVDQIVTKEQVIVVTSDGTSTPARILGIEAGQVKLDGEVVPSVPLERLTAINPPPKVDPAWTGTLKVSALWVEGNTDRRQVGSALDASRRSEIDRISFDAAWDYAEDKRREDPATAESEFGWELSQRRAGAGLKYDYFLTKRWYALATARVLGDTLANLDLRFTGGAGIGYTVIENATTTLLAEVGLNYFHESYRIVVPPAPDSDEYLAARVAYKLTHEFTKDTKFLHSVEAFPSVESADDVYLQAKTEIVTTLMDNMIGSVAHVIDYDNTPSPGFERVDNRILLSIGWSF